MSTAGQPAFSLHPALRAADHRDAFEQRRRVQIQPFLSDQSIARLADHLKARDDWRLILNAGPKVFEIDRAGQQSLSELQRRELDEKVIKAARAGFQYRFESIRVSDFERERIEGATILDDFALFMASEPVLEVLRALTGFGDIHFADAQATCYGAGHFLTRHDDDVEGKNRRAAYVLGLTQGWDADWGGLLLFHSADGGVEQALAPGYNVLNLFVVPQPHSVSMVSPYAGGSRYSVTGWLRSAVPADEGPVASSE